MNKSIDTNLYCKQLAAEITFLFLLSLIRRKMSGESVTEMSACLEICKETLKKSDISERAGMFEFF